MRSGRKYVLFCYGLYLQGWSGIVSGLASPLGFRPFSACGQPSRVGSFIILIQYDLASEAASCQHQTGFYRLSWLDTLIH